MRVLAAFILLTGLGTLGPVTTAAAKTFDAVKARGSLNCGGVPRPGLAMVDAGGEWSGHGVDMCRAVAVAVLGEAKFAFRGYQSTQDFDRARKGDDDVSFLTPDEIVDQNLGASLRRGPPVFVDRQAVMVAAGSPFKRPSDLSGRAICFIIATASEDALEAWAPANKIDFIPNAFQETDEMIDAYNVQRCQAVVGEATELAAIGRDGGINHLKSRLLPEPLATVSILVATPREADDTWADVVAHALAAASPLGRDGRP